MRILQIHNNYQFTGGEDVAVEAEYSLLQSNGNDVNLFEVSNENIRGTKAKIETAINVSYSKKYSNKLVDRIGYFQPEIVHVHNFFPLLTPSIYDVCKSFGLPVIQTLHNYRIICPGAYLMKNGVICEDCLTGSAFKAALHGCYRDSRIGSLPVAYMVQTHRKRKTWQKKIDRFIALTEFAMNKFIQAGLPSERIEVKPNFIHPDPGTGNGNGKYALFVGRISKEKGIVTLLQAWKKIRGVPIKFVGDGSLIEETRKIAIRKNLHDVELLGIIDRKDVLTFMEKAIFLVFPSECYEGFPMTVAEAFACGLPVLSSRIGGMTEIVENGVTGLHFEPGDSDDLADKAQWLVDNPDVCARMGKNARQVFLEKYSANKNYEILMDIYQKAIDENK
jgi:glycosyltransferase involved in cell wall biosynthesis